MSIVKKSVSGKVQDEVDNADDEGEVQGEVDNADEVKVQGKVDNADDVIHGMRKLWKQSGLRTQVNKRPDGLPEWILTTKFLWRGGHIPGTSEVNFTLLLFLSIYVCLQHLLPCQGGSKAGHCIHIKLQHLHVQLVWPLTASLAAVLE